MSIEWQGDSLYVSGNNVRRTAIDEVILVTISDGSLARQDGEIILGSRSVSLARRGPARDWSKPGRLFTLVEGGN
jgi:hypothetical protein